MQVDGYRHSSRQGCRDRTMPLNEREECLKRVIIAREEKDIPYLIGALNIPDVAIRRIAIRYLVKLNAQESGPALIRLLQAADRDVRIAAIIALGKLRIHSAVEPLLEIARTDKISVVREWALGALRDIDSKACLEATRDAWDDVAWEVRRTVIKLLSELGNREDYARLREAYTEESDRRRRRKYRKAIRAQRIRLDL